MCSEGFTCFTALHADSDHSVYLVKTSEMHLSADQVFVKVTRETATRFHLDLLGRKHQYKLSNLDMAKRYSVLVPVESIPMAYPFSITSPVPLR
jgi:hypothetical protein